MAVIDPGPESELHVDAVAGALRDADTVSIVVTHGHPDHAPAARALAHAVHADVRGPAALGVVTRPLEPGAAVPTDVGDLIAVDTPGHARDHIALYWPARRALFAGDLLLGEGDAVWVGAYRGCVGDYLASLGRVAELDLRVIYPAHGRPLEDPTDAIERFRRHRLWRIRQVEEALAADRSARVEDLVEVVYGESLPQYARRAALASLQAMKEHVESEGR